MKVAVPAVILGVFYCLMAFVFLIGGTAQDSDMFIEIGMIGLSNLLTLSKLLSVFLSYY